MENQEEKRGCLFKFKTKVCKVEVWLSIYCLFQDNKCLSLDLEK